MAKNADISEMVNNAIDGYITKILNALVYTGFELVNNCRQYGHGKDYKDRTGNLRSSVGFAVYYNGQRYNGSGFEPIKGEEGDGTEGSTKGAEFTSEVAAKYPKGAVLILVAGMEYAEYVAKKGFNVIQSGELLAATLIPQVFEKFGIKVSSYD